MPGKKKKKKRKLRMKHNILDLLSSILWRNAQKFATHNEINHVQFSNFYCPSKEEPNFKSSHFISQSEMRLFIFTKVFEVQAL